MGTGPSLEQQKQDIKNSIRSLLRKGEVEWAKTLLVEYQEQVPGDPDIPPLVIDAFIQEGSYEEALQIISQALQRNPKNFQYLFHWGKVYEAQGEFLSAWNRYRHAVEGVSSPKDKERLDTALNRVKNKVQTKSFFEKEKYSIRAEGNKEPVLTNYSMIELLQRKAILQTLLETMDAEGKTVLEIQCGEGVITRTLNSLGYDMFSVEENDARLQQAAALDIMEYIRVKEASAVDLFRPFTVNTDTVRDLGTYDIVLVLPRTWSWYKQRGREGVESILKALAKKANKQLFLHLPPGDDEDIAIRDLVQGLKEHCSIFSCGEGNGELICLSHKPVHKESIIPTGLEILKSSSHIFEVPLTHCIDVNVFSYGEKGWHPWIELGKEFQEQPEIQYHQSFLYTFYRKYRPRNRQQQWLDDTESCFYPLSVGWPNVPWFIQGGNVRIIPKKFVSELVQIRKGNQHFGPNTDRFGMEELDRMKSIFRLMERGYHPEIVPDGYITGQILREGNDYRFLVTEGQHRLPALALQGYKTIRVKFNKDTLYTQVVDIKDIYDWHLVRRGLYTIDVAKRVFDRFMADKSIEKAKYWQLIT